MPLNIAGFLPSFGGERPIKKSRAGAAPSSAPSGSQRKTIGGKGVIDGGGGGGKGKHGIGGLGLGKGGLKRHRYVGAKKK